MLGGCPQTRVDAMHVIFITHSTSMPDDKVVLCLRGKAGPKSSLSFAGVGGVQHSETSARSDEIASIDENKNDSKAKTTISCTVNQSIT